MHLALRPSFPGKSSKVSSFYYLSYSTFSTFSAFYFFPYFLVYFLTPFLVVVESSSINPFAVSYSTIGGIILL